MIRRRFLKTALALPAIGMVTPFDTMVASAAGTTKVTDMKLRPLSSHTLIRIDTDSGISGYGESGVTLQMMLAWRERYLPLLKNQDPTAISYHFQRMSTLMHTYMASVPALSGIDMALWDLAGKLTNRPVYELLGGPFRTSVPLFINSEPRNMLDRSVVAEWAGGLKANPLGFKGVKINVHTILGIPMGVYTTTLRAQDLNKIRTSYENVRNELGLDYDIMVHCHNEFDLPSSIGIARAVEDIKPAWLEDPLPVHFNDSWVSLKRDCNVPLLTGEKSEMPAGFYPFLKNQTVDYLYPDIAFCGGLTSIKKIADIAELYRVPISTHNVGNIFLTMASIHFGLSIQDFYTSETALGGGNSVLRQAKNPPVIEGGRAMLPTGPGLGVDLNEEAIGGEKQGWI
jgi:L-alanine-DL-glutamate epimerase-like enolase superfamily enzyme